MATLLIIGGIGDLKFEIGNLRFEIGNWRLEIGDWRDDLPGVQNQEF
jgi:hypothetical protein